MGIRHFAEDFYCSRCGSTTAIFLHNLNLIRCMGCLSLYKKGDRYNLIDKHPHAWQPTLTISRIESCINCAYQD